MFPGGVDRDHLVPVNVFARQLAKAPVIEDLGISCEATLRESPRCVRVVSADVGMIFAGLPCDIRQREAAICRHQPHLVPDLLWQVTEVALARRQLLCEARGLLTYPPDLGLEAGDRFRLR